MTEKSNEQIEKEVKSAAELASKMAELMVQETQSSRKAIYASAILYASLAGMYGMSMHDAMGLLMELYRKHEQFLKEQE
jgi:hypothetical protein